MQLLGSLGPQTPVGRSLLTRGPGLHHLAYRVADIEAALEHLRAEGVHLIDEAPALSRRAPRSRSCTPRSMEGVLVELVQEG